MAHDKFNLLYLQDSVAAFHDYHAGEIEMMFLQEATLFVYNGGPEDAWVNDVLFDDSLLKLPALSMADYLATGAGPHMRSKSVGTSVDFSGIFGSDNAGNGETSDGDDTAAENGNGLGESVGVSTSESVIASSVMEDGYIWLSLKNNYLCKALYQHNCRNSTVSTNNIYLSP